MRLIPIIAFLAMLIMSSIAEPDSVITGPYKISFDLGLNHSTYNITVNDPKTTESLAGIERTDYELQIFSGNKTKIKSDFNKSSFSNLTASDIARLFTTYDVRTATIAIKEFKEPKQVENAEDYEEALKQTDGDYPDFRVASRKIDGGDGAVASISVIIDPNNPLGTSLTLYHIIYGKAFDPSHVLVEISSMYPWDEGTLQLLKTIQIEKINSTS